jgi:hypothetical protein
VAERCERLVDVSQLTLVIRTHTFTHKKSYNKID